MVYFEKNISYRSPVLTITIFDGFTAVEWVFELLAFFYLEMEPIKTKYSDLHIKQNIDYETYL